MFGSDRVSYRALLFQQGVAFLEHGRPAQAISPLLQALKEPGPGPALADILSRIAAAYGAAGNNEEAFRTLLEAAEVDPSRAAALWREARAFVTAHLSPAVWSWLDSEWLGAWLSDAPAAGLRVDALLLAARVAVSAGEYAKALDILKEAAEACAQETAAVDELTAQLDKISDGFTRADDFINAAAALRIAIELKPDEVRRRWSLMDVLFRKSFTKVAPFVNRDDIQESVRAWNEALEYGSPGPADAWAWTARAVINEQLVRLPESDGWQLGWEAAAYCERGLVLNDADTWHWTNLVRWHRYLNLTACDDYATNALLEVQGDEPTIAALDERILFLSNVGRFDEMESVVARRRAIEDSPWLTGVEAFTRLHLGENEGAIEMAGKCLDFSWCREVRAAAYRRMGKTTEAAEEYQRLLDAYSPEDREEQLRCARAAFYLGQIDRAIEMGDTYLSRYALPTDGTVRIELGLFHLVKGNVESGRKLITDGIAIARDVRSLDEIFRFEIASVEQMLRTVPHGPEVQALLDKPRVGIKARLAKRIAEMNRHPNTAEEELNEMLSTRGGEDGGWLAVAVEAGLARLCKPHDRARAAAAYRSLLEREPLRFGTARDALERIARLSIAEGDKLASHDPAGAAQHYAAALATAPAGSAEIAADAHAGLAFTAAAGRNLGETAAELQRAVDVTRGLGDNIEARVSNRFVSLITDEQSLWRADSALESIARSVPADRPLVHAAIDSARSGLLDKLSELYGASESFPADRWPAATPIVLEIGSGLIPEDTGENWTLFKAYIPEMRRRIQSQTGVLLPGVHVRESSSSQPGVYTIALLDVARPLEGGSVPTDHRFCLAVPELVQELGIPKEDLIPASQPGKRALGCWIRSQDWERVTSAGLELWAEPLVYVIRQLEASIVRHLDEFLGVDEASKILDKWREISESKELVDVVLSSASDRLHFARLARALARDHVPLVRGDIILGVLRDKPLNTVSFPSVVRNIRLQLRNSLPGNGPDAKRVNLPPEWETIVSRWASGARESPVGDQAYELIRSVRSELSGTSNGSPDQEFALVVRRSAAAPLVRRLLRYEIPDLAVLAQEEVL